MLLTLLVVLALGASEDFDSLWAQYHAAGDPAGRELAWHRLRQGGWPDDFDLTVQRLRTRAYSPEVATGVLRESRVDLDGNRYRYVVLIPSSYDPARAYPLRMVLHGSTRRAAWGENEQHWRHLDPFRSEDAITVFPAAWDEAMWWSERQIANLAAILDDLRARYHIDTNRCTLTGISDGGTGTFYHALRAPTPWAAFLPLIGHPWVLGNPEEEADGDIFAANLSGRSLMVINGADDPLYPAASLPSYLDLFERAGAEIEFKIKPGGHNVRWWPEEAAAMRAFRESHPRDPFPDELVFESDGRGRVNWIVIESIGDRPPEDPDPLNTVLFRDLDPPTRAEAFPRHRPSGRITARRQGNRIEVETRNIHRAVLLLGLGEFDVAQTVELAINGVSSTHRLQPSVEVLMKWAIRDGDPELLVSEEIEILAEP